MSRKKTPQDFAFKERLGNGSYSTVYKAVDRATAQVFAIKVCSKKHIISENKVKYVTIEKNTLNLLAHRNHPGIVKLHYTFHDSENLYFVLDFAPGGELLQLLQAQGRFSETWSRHFMCQLIDALEYIHDCKVVHRDLKPENLLLSNDGRLMITDFGVASNLNPSEDGLSSSSSFVGTAEYVSPELLLHNKSHYGSDIWALGCMLYQFTQGVPPFRGENELAAFEKIVSLDYRWLSPVSPLIRDLVSKILVIEPSERFTLRQVKNHTWFQGIVWENKELLWKGIWQLCRKPNSIPPNNSMSLNKQLHVIDTPIRNIPIQSRKRKPMKVTQTTSNIVEWRRTLGIPSISSSLGTNGLPKLTKTNKQSSGSVTTSPLRKDGANQARQGSLSRNISTTTFNKPSLPCQVPASPRHETRSNSPSLPSPKPDVTTNGIEALQKPVNLTNGKRPLTPPTSPKPLKQGWVKILEIPYVASTKKVFSHAEYSFIDDRLITKFISEQKSHIMNDSLLSILTLDPNGQFSYTPRGGTPRQMISIIDQDLSIYDLEFDESKNSGCIIFEKFKSTVWFITLPKSSPNGLKINTKQTWIQSLFQTKSTLEADRLSKKVDNLRLQKSSISSSSTNHKKPGTDRLIVSSSRPEVLRTLSKQKTTNSDAANGASAAFKNMQR